MNKRVIFRLTAVLIAAFAVLYACAQPSAPTDSSGGEHKLGSFVGPTATNIGYVDTNTQPTTGSSTMQGAVDNLKTRMASANGANLGNGSATILLDAGNWRILPASTLDASATLTVSGSGTNPGDQITITRLDTGAFTYAIADGTSGTLVTMPASKINAAVLQMGDAGSWSLRQIGAQ